MYRHQTNINESWNKIEISLRKRDHRLASLITEPSIIGESEAFEVVDSIHRRADELPSPKSFLLAVVHSFSRRARRNSHERKEGRAKRVVVASNRRWTVFSERERQRRRRRADNALWSTQFNSRGRRHRNAARSTLPAVIKPRLLRSDKPFHDQLFLLTKKKKKEITHQTDFANFSKYPLNTANSMRELQCRFKSRSYW